jgi:hypothetical protein
MRSKLLESNQIDRGYNLYTWVWAIPLGILGESGVAFKDFLLDPVQLDTRVLSHTFSKRKVHGLIKLLHLILLKLERSLTSLFERALISLSSSLPFHSNRST